jgi:riboflavin kinase
MGCIRKMREVSSSKLANILGSSQQTASRRIRRLEEEEYIVREVLPRGQRIRITSKGLKALRALHQELEKILQEYETCVYIINGEVTSGLGEGGYYMRIQGYREQFREKIGFDPYPGTLNLKLKTEDDRRTRQILQDLEGIEIKGFREKDRTFGPVKCFKAEIDGIEGAVVIPERTHHGFDSLEVIAPQKIRDALNLRDGDIVSVKVSI